MRENRITPGKSTQAHREHVNALPILVLDTGTPRGYVLSPALFTLFTHGSTAFYSSNTLVKFSDLVGLISLQGRDPAPDPMMFRKQPDPEQQYDREGRYGPQKSREKMTWRRYKAQKRLFFHRKP